jgi:hypothetical protein
MMMIRTSHVVGALFAAATCIFALDLDVNDPGEQAPATIGTLHNSFVLI